MKTSQNKRFRREPDPAETLADFNSRLMLNGIMGKRKHSTRPPGSPPRRGRGVGRPERPSGRRPKRRPATKKAGADWIYGIHAVRAAALNPLRRRHRLVATRTLDAETRARLAAAEGGPALEIIGRDALEALLPPGAVHQGLALLADPLPPVSLNEVCTKVVEKAVVVVLDQATDPHNVGAVVRSAAAFGALAVVVQDRHAPAATGALAKAASGALETVPLVRVTNITRALDSLKESGFWCLGLEARAGAPLGDVDLAVRVALVLGSEGGGLRRLVARSCDFSARIPMIGPMAGGAESLNLSNAAAIALYALFRRPPPS